MKKNYKKYGQTGILWALYLIVGVVAFLVSDFYFKFEPKDALIFGAVNLVVVVLITEGIDLLSKKVKLHQERKNAETEPAEESPSEESISTAEERADKAIEPDVTPVRTDGEVSPNENPETEGDIAPTADAIQEIEESSVAHNELPMLITDARGSGKNFDLLERVIALQNSESDSSESKETSVDTDVAESAVESPVSEEPLSERAVEPVVVESSKPRGRRANPEAIIDAPTSSIPVITPDMIKPRVETVAEPVVEEPVAEETYLSADEFLSTTKLTSPRAIVREYQRLGGKDDIFNILMERQK